MNGNVVRLPARAPEGGLNPFNVSNLPDKPKPRDWIIDGVLLRGSVMLLTGAPKIGKSLLLQQILTSLSLGENWLGLDVPAQANCYGLFCEDSQEELERRQVGLNAYFDKEPPDFESRFWWESREGKDGLLVDFIGDRPVWTKLWHQLVDVLKENSIQILGLDTAAVVFGGNENFRNHTTAFLRTLQQLAAEINGAVILNAHPSRSNPNSFAGNTAWLASVRAGLSLGRPPEYDENTGQPRNARMLRGLGMNYGQGITVERLEWRDGVFVCDDISANPKRAPSRPQNAAEWKALESRLLEGLVRVIQNGAKVPADELAAGSLPLRARRSGDEKINRVPYNDLNIAQHHLLEQQLVVRVNVAGRCLLRPADGPYYEGEVPWRTAPAPTTAQAAD